MTKQSELKGIEQTSQTIGSGLGYIIQLATFTSYLHLTLTSLFYKLSCYMSQRWHLYNLKKEVNRL